MLPQTQKNRSSKSELRRRIKYTVELMMKDVPEANIISVLTERYPEISSTTAYRYHYLAYASLQEKDNKELARKKDFYKARKLRSLMEMDPAEKKTAAGVAVINKVINEIAAMDGIVTKRVEVRGDKENPIQVQHAHAHVHVQRTEIDYKNMPSEMLELLLSQARGNRTLLENK